MSPSDSPGAHEPNDTPDSADMNATERDDASASGDSPPSDDRNDLGTESPDAGAAEEEIDAEELMAELERLREEVTQLRARQAASRHSSWVQRHPALTVFLTTALGAAAGYLGSRMSTSSEFSKATREQLRTLAEQARTVASDVQHEIEALRRPSKKKGSKSASNAGGKGSVGGDGAASAQTPAGNASAGAPRGRQEGSSLSVGNVLESVAGTATRARDTVRTKAKSATKDAAAKAVRNFASDDDFVPVEMKAKAAGVAATTLGAALARKLIRTAGSVLASMLIAYLTKKVVDLVLRR